MKYLLIYISIVLSLNLYASDNALTCNTEKSPNKIFKCTFKAASSDTDRNFTFEWSNELTPQDHRMRMVLFPAQHRSIYDYRNYFGRAKGEWHIVVKDDEDAIVATTTFNLE